MTSSPDQQEGTPADLPQNLPVAVRKLAPGWRHRIVWGNATCTVKEPAPDQRTTARLADVAGKRKAVRKTIDVARPLLSVSLRVQHEDGTRAWACWTRHQKLTRGQLGWTAWTFTGAGVLEPGSVPTYDVGWSEFYAAVQWIPDELERAA